MDTSKKLKFSILIPVYQGSATLEKALKSIVNQAFENYEIIIGDDNPLSFKEEIEKTKAIINYLDKKNITRYIKNKHNLGYARNLQHLVSLAQGDIIFLMAQDDILSQKSLQLTHDAFFLDPDIGVVTRPYFWFMDDIKKPVRAVLPYDQKRNAILSIFDGEKEFLKIFESAGQLSGLAYRKKWLEIPFHDECFPAHIYPLAGILRKHKCVFLADYTVAVGIKSSQTRSLSSIYDLSPTESWLKMYRTVFAGPAFKKQRHWGEKHITTNFLGLVQIRNYAQQGVFWKEVGVLLKNHRENWFDPLFWFFVIGCTVIPRNLLKLAVDWYKNKINTRLIQEIEFEYF